jgi:methyl-accepting chemotaxis protein
MITRMTIGKKLTGGFTVMVALILALGIFALMTMQRLNNLQDILAQRESKKLELSGLLQTNVARLRLGIRGVILATLSNNKEQAGQADRQFRAASSESQKALADVQPLLENDRERQAVETLQARLTAFTPVYEEIARLCAAGQTAEAQKARTEKAIPLADNMDAATEQLRESTREAFAATDQAFEDSGRRARWISILLIGLCLAVGAAVLLLVRQISGSLRAMAGEMSLNAGQVASAANQVASSGQSLAQGSSEQAASLEETSASSEEINSMARRNTENSRVVAELASGSQQKVTQTNQSLEEMVSAMAEISASSGKISKIIKVIDEISFQTNILALNAAVEAARAGEAGMGFAVVADEVRNLAQRCAQAARDTTSLIEESIAKSAGGQGKVQQVAGAILAIAEESGKVKTLADEVNLGSQEQARGIEQVAKAITQMEQVTQRTAASAEESASAAQQLLAQSEALNDIVKTLTAMVGAG